jgi:hypothetical protein
MNAKKDSISRPFFASSMQIRALCRGTAVFCLACALPLAAAVPAVDTARTTQALTSETTLAKVGEARLRVLLWTIYDSRLYTPTGDYREGVRPLRLEIEYLRDIKAEALIERTKDEWAAMGREHPRQDAWLDELSTLWPDIRENDVLSIELNEENEAFFTRNGEMLGRIHDPDFGQQFIDIWLSEDCTRPELRASLIGARSGN